MKVYHLQCGYGVSAEGDVRDGIRARSRSNPKPIRMDALIDMRVDGASSAFVLGVVHREVGIDAGEVSLLTVHINMLQAEKPAVAVAVGGW